MHWKFLLILLAFTNSKAEEGDSICDVENPCYSVIEAKAELHKKQINENDQRLRDDEGALNSIIPRNSTQLDNFEDHFKKVDDKINALLKDVTTGIDGGNKTLTEIINVFGLALNAVRVMYGSIKREVEQIVATESQVDLKLAEVLTRIEEIQKELEKLQKNIGEEGEEALLSALNKSKQFHNDSQELHDILKEIQNLETQYEGNITNFQNTTKNAELKIKDLEKLINDTETSQKDISEGLKIIFQGQLHLAITEIGAIEKLAKESLDKAGQVYDDAFNQLDEVNSLKTKVNIEELEKQIKSLVDHDEISKENLKEFVDSNLELLKSMKKNIETARINKKRAQDSCGELDRLLNELKDLYDSAVMSVAIGDETLRAARHTLISLDGFQEKTEKSAESARMALERVASIVKIIRSAEEILKKAEDGLEESYKNTVKAKANNLETQKKFEKILEDAISLKTGAADARDKLKALLDELSALNEKVQENSDLIDKLQIDFNAQEKETDKIQESVVIGKDEVLETDKEVEKVLAKIQKIVDALNDYKDIDAAFLDEFEEKLLEAENELKLAQLDERVLKLETDKRDQDEAIANYKQELCDLETQVCIIKDNSKSLERGCFRRTRLEP